MPPTCQPVVPAQHAQGSCLPHLYAGQLPQHQHRPKEGLPGCCIPQVPVDIPGVAAVLHVGPDVVTVVHSANLTAVESSTKADKKWP